MKLIYKVAAAITKDRKVLIVKSNKAGWIAPGGKVEAGEGSVPCLQRELQEELGITFDGEMVSYLGAFTSMAHGNAKTWLHMRVYLVESYFGAITPQAEITECSWAESREAAEMDMGSIMQEKIIPLLKQKDLID